MLRTYASAINNALDLAMAHDPTVFVYGIEVEDSVFGTTAGLAQKYGNNHRVFNTPMSEQALTGLAIGAASQGLRPVLIHQRVDFMCYSMDQIVNWMALWRFKSGLRTTLPIVIRACIGRGWGQGPQHAKSLHPWFAHIPGLRVYMPATPSDAKGMLLAAIASDDPTIVLEGRDLYNIEEEVQDGLYLSEQHVRLRLQHGTVSALTVVTFGPALPVVMEAATAEHQITVFEIPCLAPFPSIDQIIASVKRTGRLLVVEPGWLAFGAGSEIVARVHEALGGTGWSSRRIGWQPTHVPMAKVLEQAFYPDVWDVRKAIREMYR